VLLNQPSKRASDQESERRESNPRSQLGKLMYCLCTTLAERVNPTRWPRDACRRLRACRLQTEGHRVQDLVDGAVALVGPKLPERPVQQQL
jgi:hypothetical protein